MQQYKEKSKKLIREYLSEYTPRYIEYLKERYQGYRYICGFGVGATGKLLPEIVDCLGRKVDFYCDNDLVKVGKKDPYGFGIDVISVEEAMEYKDDMAVLVPSRFFEEIYVQLSSLGFPLVDKIIHGKIIIDEYLRKNNTQEIINNLEKTIDILADKESCRVLTRIIQEWTTDEYGCGQMQDIYTVPQYYPEGIIENNGSEVFADCGAYIGDGIPDFMHFVNGKFKKYYAFELTQKNFQDMKCNIEKNMKEFVDRIVLVNKGVSDSNGIIRYIQRGQGSKLSEEGTESGMVISLDEYFKDKEAVSFIKMDIEGAELSALKGAKETISKSYPKLAISIYHKPEDLWMLPLFVKDTWNEYNIFIRHHTDLLSETVCYAVRK